MFCQKCGNEIKDGAKFCDKCGTAVYCEQNITVDSANVGTPVAVISICKVDNINANFTQDFMEHHGKCGDMVILSGNFLGIIRTYRG